MSAKNIQRWGNFSLSYCPPSKTRFTFEEIVPDSRWIRNVFYYRIDFVVYTNPKQKLLGSVVSPEILNPETKVGTLNP